MDPESSLYVMSALAHHKYTLSDESFREIKPNTVPRNMFYNKRSGAVVMSPDFEGLGAAVVVGVGANLTQSPVVFHISPCILFFWSTCTCVSNDPGLEFFVEVCYVYVCACVCFHYII